MPVGAVLGGLGAVAGGVGSAVAGGEQAGAQREAAQLQFQAQQNQLAQQRQTREAAQAAAEPSAQELQALQKQIQTSESSIQRQERILEATDPALIEAGQQALQLLRGKESAALAPIQRQRARQRRELENRLRSQIGPGFETSSAGIEALSGFDEGTTDVLAGAQQQTLGQLLGLSAQVRGQASQEQRLSAGAPIGSLQGLANRRVGAITGTPIGGVNVPGGITARGPGAGATALGILGAGAGAVGGAFAEQQRFGQLKDLFGSTGGASGAAGALGRSAVLGAGTSTATNLAGGGFSVGGLFG